tara:strand:+ start:2248 stop:3069 length:822 start_codon:yes stop_codon:yes gene_type:complete
MNDVTNKDLCVLSLGAGVQSTTMALMAAQGEFDKMPDCAIFADTGYEPAGVYTHLDWLEAQLPFPVYRVTAGNIKDDHLDGINTTGQLFASMPLFTAGGGMARRQCTHEYKISPIRKKTRELLGVGFGERVPKKLRVEMWIGISTDEASRMKPSRDKWQDNVWPLIDKRMSRWDCRKWFEQRHSGRTLAKSACIACPYRDSAGWRDMKDNDPISWTDAIEFDAAIRNKGSDGIQFPKYLHRSMVPLSEVDLTTVEDEGQINFFNEECEGMCGV